MPHTLTPEDEAALALFTDPAERAAALADIQAEALDPATLAQVNATETISANEAETERFARPHNFDPPANNGSDIVQPATLASGGTQVTKEVRIVRTQTVAGIAVPCESYRKDGTVRPRSLPSMVLRAGRTLAQESMVRALASDAPSTEALGRAVLLSRAAGDLQGVARQTAHIIAVRTLHDAVAVAINEVHKHNPGTSERNRAVSLSAGLLIASATANRRAKKHGVSVADE